MLASRNAIGPKDDCTNPDHRLYIYALLGNNLLLPFMVSEVARIDSTSL